MKKLTVLLTAILLLSLMVGCNKKAETTTGEVENKTPETTQTETTQTPTTETEKTETPATQSDLSGLELIKSFDVKMPEALYIEGITKMEGITMTQKMYIRGEDFRTESSGDFGNQIMIYNSTEGITYMYGDGMPTGTMMKDDPEEEAMMEEDDDEMMAQNYGEALFDSVSDGLLKAEKTVYNGYDVLYMEVSEEGGMVIKQWISTEFWYPIRVEASLNGKVITEYEVFKISSAEAKDSKLYEKPDGIEFMDLGQMMTP